MKIQVKVKLTWLNQEKWKLKSIEASYSVSIFNTIIQTWKIEWLNVAVRIVRMWLKNK